MTITNFSIVICIGVENVSKRLLSVCAGEDYVLRKCSINVPLDGIIYFNVEATFSGYCACYRIVKGRMAGLYGLRVQQFCPYGCANGFRDSFTDTTSQVPLVVYHIANTN